MLFSSSSVTYRVKDSRDMSDYLDSLGVGTDAIIVADGSFTWSDIPNVRVSPAFGSWLIFDIDFGNHERGSALMAAHAAFKTMTYRGHRCLIPWAVLVGGGPDEGFLGALFAVKYDDENEIGEIVRDFHEVFDRAEYERNELER